MNFSLVTVVYNTGELLRACLASFASLYGAAVPIVVIDGSTSGRERRENAAVCRALGGVSLFTVGYNIHHGPGMHLALVRYVRTEYALLVDSDLEFTAAGIFDEIGRTLKPETIYAGELRRQDYRGFDDFNTACFDTGCADPVPYIHPHCMVVRTRAYGRTTSGAWTRPFFRHGSPCLATMIDLKHFGDSSALQSLPGLARYYRHSYRGTAQPHGYSLDGCPSGIAPIAPGEVPRRRLETYLLEQASLGTGWWERQRLRWTIRRLLLLRPAVERHRD